MGGLRWPTPTSIHSDVEAKFGMLRELGTNLKPYSGPNTAMKVLLLSNVFPPGFIGGYELGALEIANHLTTSGHEVNVLTSDFSRTSESS